MDRGVGAAARLLPEGDRKDLAIQALARSEAVSDLAARHGVSRKFVYKQTHKAHAALDDAFSSAKRDEEEVLFELVRIPTESSRPFRRKPAGDSDGNQPPIPRQSSHP
jgi:hypothetical protein